MNRKTFIAATAALVIVGCGQNDNPVTDSGGDGAPSGRYAVDRLHTYLSFSYLHQGLSYPLLRATDVMGELQFDSEDMSNSIIDVSVAAASIRTNVEHFDKELASRKFFNADKYPYMTFSTDHFEATSDNEGVLHGNVTIKGVTKPLELVVTFNDGFVHPVLEVPVLGFSATGSLSRSDFGLDRFVPVVSDTVVLNIEVEFRHGSTDESLAAASIARDGV